MSRAKAIKDLDLAHEQNVLNKQGIVHRMTEQRMPEEAAGAYKNIDEVMEAQKDLVQMLVKLTPPGVVKVLSDKPFWRTKEKSDKITG